MLSRWFTRSNRLEHADPAIRLQAVNGLTAEQATDSQELLARLAGTDADVQVRQAAIAWLADGNLLAPLLDDKAVADAAVKRVCALVKQGQMPTCAQHVKVVSARIATCTAEDLESLWPLLSTPQQCAELALQLREAARDKVLIHPLLQAEEGLTVLQKAARGRDKYCHRHARERLDQIKQTRATITEQNQRLTELDSAIHKALKQEPAEPGALLVHRQKLLRLRDMRADLVQTLTTHQQQLIAAGGEVEFSDISADPLANVDLSLPDPSDNPFIHLSEQWRALQQKMFAGEDAEALYSEQQNLTSQWLDHANRIPPSAEQHALFSDVTRQLQAFRQSWQRSEVLRGEPLPTPDRLPEKTAFDQSTPGHLQTRRNWLKRWKKTILSVNWPESHTQPSWLIDAQAQLAQIEGEVERLQALTADAGRQMAKLIDHVDKALNEGHIEDAIKHMRQARELQKAGISENDAALANLSARLAEFRDWQKFATDPKRHDLLNAIEQLASHPLTPADQASRIKDLREQWRALGRPISAEHIAQQQQFDSLAEQAFEPCKTYFAERAQLRQDNLEARIKLCEQLQAYVTQTDWQQTDIQAAEHILRSARQEWHLYRPCDRKALKPVEQTFEELQETLHNKIKSVWNDNVAAKQVIVTEAQAQAAAAAENNDDEVINAAIQSAKNLQQQWRTIGHTPRSADQKLWRDFRSACDQIFALREAANTASRQASAEQLQRFEAAVTDFENAAIGPDHSRQALDGFINDLNNLAQDIPLTAAHRQRVESARETYRDALKTLARAGVLADLKQFETWDIEVSNAEAGGEMIEAPHPVFAPRVAGDAGTEDWLALTLEAEIAADIPSPDADRSARMALQVDLMNAGRRDLAQEDWKALRNRWCAAGPKDARAQALRSRFFAALSMRL